MHWRRCQKGRQHQTVVLLIFCTTWSSAGSTTRNSASTQAGAIEKLVEREVRIDDKTVAILENWLAEPITDAETCETTIPAQRQKPEAAMGSAPDEPEEEDCTHRSMLWGHGGISRMPSGDSSVLVALVGILLAREELDRLYRTLDAYLDRCKDPQAWDRVLEVLPRPSQDEAPRREDFLKRLFAEVPWLVESKAAVYTVRIRHTDGATHLFGFTAGPMEGF